MSAAPDGPAHKIRKTGLRIAPKAFACLTEPIATACGAAAGALGLGAQRDRFCYLFTMSNTRDRPCGPSRIHIHRTTLAHQGRGSSDQTPGGSDQGSGGARRVRTDDLKLAKLPLSQLSYGPFWLGRVGLAATAGADIRLLGWRARRQIAAPPKWWAWDDSNVRPHPYQGCALTT
jgi:hypothetical protein